MESSDKEAMMRYSVDDVVAYILAKSGSISTVKLQKLLYYAHGWSYALINQPLFPNRIEAWKFGPVVTDVYKKHRKARSIDSESWGSGDANRVPETQQRVINAVWETYGGLSGFKLADMTHEETPYKVAWAQNPPGTLAGIEIQNEEISKFFKGLRRRSTAQADRAEAHAS